MEIRMTYTRVSLRVTGQHEGGVQAAEGERVRKCDLYLRRARAARDNIDPTCRIEAREVGSWGNYLAFECKNRSHSFNCSRCSEGMAVHRLRRVHQDFVRVIPKHVPNGLRFRNVVG